MQSKFEVNVSISKFKIAFKIYLQEHSLQLKYTKLEYSMYSCSTILFYYYLYIIILHFHIPFYFVNVAAAVDIYTKDAYITK